LKTAAERENPAHISHLPASARAHGASRVWAPAVPGTYVRGRRRCLVLTCVGAGGARYPASGHAVNTSLYALSRLPVSQGPEAGYRTPPSLCQGVSQWFLLVSHSGLRRKGAVNKQRHPGAGRDLQKNSRAYFRASLKLTESLGGPGLRRDDGFKYWFGCLNRFSTAFFDAGVGSPYRDRAR